MLPRNTPLSIYIIHTFVLLDRESVGSKTANQCAASAYFSQVEQKFIEGKLCGI